MRIQFDISDEEEKALKTEIEDITIWAGRVVHHKADVLMNGIIVEVSDKNPKKISRQEKWQIVKDAKVKTALEKQAESEAELKAKKP